MKELAQQQLIERRIFIIRGHKVMLDKELAILYGVKTKNLNKAVSRNLDRFPDDFMFQLTKKEFKNLKFHFGTSSWGGTRKMPRVFTEHGILMLSSVIRNWQATHVNIQIMRTFVRLRQAIANHKELAQKLEELERRMDKHDKNIIAIFEIIKELMKPPALPLPSKPKGPIGFYTH
ncbi:MAG: ORF6N domain-containing protein [Candidatus Omnitrophica bacterium]|nr:ORF6N domain-containing protein [Candidatus Omnitrophota bacterium]